jgi:hypothetical protein
MSALNAERWARSARPFSIAVETISFDKFWGADHLRGFGAVARADGRLLGVRIAGEVRASGSSLPDSIALLARRTASAMSVSNRSPAHR